MSAEIAKLIGAAFCLAPPIGGLLVSLVFSVIILTAKDCEPLVLCAPGVSRLCFLVQIFVIDIAKWHIC